MHFNKLVKAIIAVICFSCIPSSTQVDEISIVDYEANFTKIRTSSITLYGRWHSPPDIIICDKVVTTSRMKTALNFWERLGYTFGSIKQENDVLECMQPQVNAIKVMLPTSSHDMQNKMAITETTKLEINNQIVKSEISVFVWAANRALVLEHEIGHALGWKHTRTYTHIMHPEWKSIGHMSDRVKHTDYLSFDFSSHP